MRRCRLGVRGGALSLTIAAVLAPIASAAGASGQQDVPLVAPRPAEVRLSAAQNPTAALTGADHPSPRHHPSRRARVGTDEQHDAGDAEETRAERDVVLASTWHLDPELLVPQATDSAETAAAREELAQVNARLPEVVATYDTARARAVGAALRAELATKELRRASAAATRARARWEADRALLVSYVTEAYTTSSTGPLGVLVSVHSEEDLFTAMTMLQEMSDTQSTAVEDAARSRDRLQAAARHVAVVRARAQVRAAAADAALAQATAARQEVLRKLHTARRILKASVLADQLAALRARRQEAAAAAAVVTGRVVDGPGGRTSFPLAADATFVDQGNWGASSQHWAQVHTGDDLSTACGTPVLAATDGTVLVRTDQTWSGRWLVLVSTGEGRLSTWYAHMQELLVTNGASVRAGQQIGVVGAEGNATGCHLHFEVHPSGGSIYEDNTDPQAWLHAVGVYPG